MHQAIYQFINLKRHTQIYFPDADGCTVQGTDAYHSLPPLLSLAWPSLRGHHKLGGGNVSPQLTGSHSGVRECITFTHRGSSQGKGMYHLPSQGSPQWGERILTFIHRRQQTMGQRQNSYRDSGNRSRDKIQTETAGIGTEIKLK